MHTERALSDAITGALAVQYREENLLMTVIIHGQDARELRGKAVVTLDRVTVLVDDDYWERVVGRMVCLEGGTELDIDDSRLDQALEGYDISVDGPIGEDTFIPVVVRDIYMPPFHAVVPWGSLMHCVNIIEPGNGVRATGERVPCLSRCGSCIACYYDRWSAVAARDGIGTDTEGVTK